MPEASAISSTTIEQAALRGLAAVALHVARADQVATATPPPES